MCRYLATFIVSCVLAGPLGAQQPALQRGSEIRAYTRLTYVAGQLLDLSPSVIVVAGKDQSVDTLDLAEVLLVQVRDRNGWTDISPGELPAILVIPEPTAGEPTGAPRVRIRVATAHGRVDGALAAWRPDTLVLERQHGALFVVPITSGTRIQVRVRRRFALPGFVGGLVLGAGMGIAEDKVFCGSSSGCGGVLDAAVVGGILGGIFGAVMGSVGKTHWIEVPADSVRSLLATTAQQKR